MDYINKFLQLLSKKEVYSSIVTVLIAVLFYEIICYVLTKSINHGKNPFEVKKRKTITNLFKNISKFVIITIAILTILNIYGFNIKTFVAGLGITATIIGLALQDTFKDIISGISIILQSFFVIGDTVDYNGFTGEIIDFNLKCTKIMNFKNEVLVVSNRNIMEIKNLSEREQKVWVEIPVRYEDDIEKVEKVIKEKILPRIEENENTIEKSCNYLGVGELADSSVKYMINFGCKREKHWQVRRAAHKIILEEFKKANISIPYPQLEVHNEK